LKESQKWPFYRATAPARTTVRLAIPNHITARQGNADGRLSSQARTIRARTSEDRRQGSREHGNVGAGNVVDELTRDAADDAAVAAALASKRAAEDLCSAWQTSLDAINEKILDLQDATAEIADQKLRAETAAAIRMIIKESIDDSAALNVAIEKRIKSARKAAALVPEAAGIVHYLQNAKDELPRADALTVQLLESCAVATVAKTARAELVQPEQIAPKQKTVAPVPTTARYFLTKNLAWFDSEGGKHSQASLTDVDLPVELVTKARSFGAIHEMNSEIRRKNFGGVAQSTKPALANCLWLNDDPRAKSNVMPIKSSHLGDPQPMDRGPGYSFIAPTAPAMANTRAMPTEPQK